MDVISHKMVRSESLSIGRFTCACGSVFESREEIRKHLKSCSFEEQGTICTTCGSDSQVFLNYDGLPYCPSCGVAFEEPKLVYGALLINHMGEWYEKIFIEKTESTLAQLGLHKLSDLGIEFIWITFSEGFLSGFTYHAPERGLVFLVEREPQQAELTKKSFEHAVSHEIFHHYLEKLGLNVSTALKGPFSTLGSCAASLAEDIQHLKVAVRKGFRVLILDEIERVTVYYKNLPLPDRDKFLDLPPAVKLSAVVSLSLASAEGLWLCQNVNRELAQMAARRMNLVAPHFQRVGFGKLRQIIRESLKENVWQTDEEKMNGYQRILRCLDEWADKYAPELF